MQVKNIFLPFPHLSTPTINTIKWFIEAHRRIFIHFLILVLSAFINIIIRKLSTNTCSFSSQPLTYSRLHVPLILPITWLKDTDAYSFIASSYFCPHLSLLLSESFPLTHPFTYSRLHAPLTLPITLLKDTHAYNSFIPSSYFCPHSSLSESYARTRGTLSLICSLI